MKTKIKAMLLFLISIGFNLTLIAQTSNCPLDNGWFKDFQLDKFSHHYPDDGAVILSSESDTVKSVTQGEVTEVLNFQKNSLSVLVKLNDTISYVYRNLSKVLIKKGDVLSYGDALGHACKNSSNQYELTVSIRVNSKWADPKGYLMCKN